MTLLSPVVILHAAGADAGGEKAAFPAVDRNHVAWISDRRWVV